MDAALAVVDFSAETWFQLACTQKHIEWSCGLTAGKEGNYQRSSQRKHRRDVPADRVYYIQSAYSFQ